MSLDRDEDPWARADTKPSPLSAGQKRARWAATLLLLGGLGVGLAISTKQTVPAGGMSSMSGMKMGAGEEHIAITLHDVSGGRFDLPGGQPGAVLFMATDGCPECVRQARDLEGAAAAASSRPVLTLISTNPDETAPDIDRFDRAAGGLDAHYAIDDASGSLTQQFGVRETGTIVVYDREGMIKQRIPPGPDQVKQLRRALAQR